MTIVLICKERRIKALNEMCRILKPGGKALVTVWAKEQKYNNNESFYISNKTSSAPKETSKSGTENEQESQISKTHKFGKEFKNKDVFVEWNYKKTTKKKSESTASMEPVKDNKVYLRFYHVFESKELENLFEHVPDARIVESFYEQGNWCVILQKQLDDSF